MKLLLAVIAAATLGGVAPAVASAPTPTTYRAQLNRVCRGYTAKFNELKPRMDKAWKAKDGKAYGAALGQWIVLMLAQDAYIERAEVPAGMRAQMAPIHRLLRTADSHARLVVRKAANGDTRGMFAELDKIFKLAPAVNKRFDRAGLRDCGSNQA